MKKAIALLFPVAALSSASVYAAVPEGVTTAVESLAADGASIATAVLLAIVAVFAIKFLRRGF